VTTTELPRLAYSIEEAGAMLGLSAWAARAAVRRGTIPTVKLGGRRFVSAATLARLLGEPERPATQATSTNE